MRFVVRLPRSALRRRKRGWWATTRQPLVWDIRGARQAGIYAIWIDIHGSGLDAEDGVSVTPDRVVASLAELIQLERW